MDKKFRILLAFDNQQKSDVLSDILSEEYYIDQVDDVVSAVRAIERSKERVALIILSLEKEKLAKSTTL